MKSKEAAGDQELAFSLWLVFYLCKSQFTCVCRRKSMCVCL